MQDRRTTRPRAARSQLEAIDAVVGPREIQRSFPQQPSDDCQGFLETRDEVVRRVAHGAVLEQRVAGSQAKDQPAVTDLVKGIGHLRQERRIAKSGTGHEDAELDAARRHGEGRQQRPAFPHAHRWMSLTSGGTGRPIPS